MMMMLMMMMMTMTMMMNKLTIPARLLMLFLPIDSIFRLSVNETHTQLTSNTSLKSLSFSFRFRPISTLFSLQCKYIEN